MGNEKNRTEYFLQYKAAHYKRIPLDVVPEKYEQIKAAASSAGETVNGYIKKAIDSRLDTGV